VGRALLAGGAAWFDKNYGVTEMSSHRQPEDGPETFDAAPRRKPRLKRGRHNLPYWIASQVARDTMGYPDSSFRCRRTPLRTSSPRSATSTPHALRKWIDERKAEAPAATLTRYDGTVLVGLPHLPGAPALALPRVKHNTRRPT
jgi:hypothetical protein